MWMEDVVESLEAIGTLLIAWAALRVHHRVLKEHKIDTRVFKVMRAEQALGVLGMGLVLTAYILKVFNN